MTLPTAKGYYKITGITGSRNGVAIISLERAGEAIPGNPGFPVDNLVNASGRLTGHGFGFKTADGNYQFFLRGFSDPAGFSRSLHTICFNRVQRAAHRVRRCNRAQSQARRLFCSRHLPPWPLSPAMGCGNKVTCEEATGGAFLRSMRPSRRPDRPGGHARAGSSTRWQKRIRLSNDREHQSRSSPKASFRGRASCTVSLSD
jgi:hypothetical protein